MGVLYSLFVFVGTGILLCDGVVWVIRKFPTKHKKHKKHKEPKEPSLLIAYIKAKKDKVCPMLTFL
jgi:hypothetical protein